MLHTVLFMQLGDLGLESTSLDKVVVVLKPKGQCCQGWAGEFREGTEV